jgi:hypothetical protein
VRGRALIRRVERVPRQDNGERAVGRHGGDSIGLQCAGAIAYGGERMAGGERVRCGT